MQILNKIYILNGQNNISADILRAHVKSFWFDIYLPLHSNNNNIHLNLMCKIGYDVNNNTDYKTVAPLRKVNFDDKDIFIQYLLDRVGILSDSYNVQTCTSITFTYMVIDGLADDNRQLLHQSEYEVTNHNYNNIKLPLTMDHSEYGVLIAREVMDDYIRYVVRNDLRVFTVDAYGDVNKVFHR